MDTIITIFIVLLPVKTDTLNRFTNELNKVDKQVNKEYKLDFQALKKASKEAVSSACVKTYPYLLKILNKDNYAGK